jgi:hypothetical protein
MEHEYFEHSNNWVSLLSDSELSSQAFETKKYPCKFQGCRRSFAPSQSRSRHYRDNHKEETVPPKKDTVTNNRSSNTGAESALFNNNVTVNVTSERERLDLRIIDDQAVQIKATPQIKEVINLCQSFFNRENTETAIAMIKGSRTVQDNVIEMR